jgi:hypothetical protein
MRKEPSETQLRLQMLGYGILMVVGFSIVVLILGLKILWWLGGA